MKIALVFVAALFLAGCDERYRYPCQDPNNWDIQRCKKPYCSGNGTCPEDLTHYEKDASKGATVNIQKENKGACK
jgi:hypothetical protein